MSLLLEAGWGDVEASHWESFLLTWVLHHRQILCTGWPESFNRVTKAREILMFVCLQKRRQTMLCHYKSLLGLLYSMFLVWPEQWLQYLQEQWVQWRFATSQHCLPFIWRQTNIKISQDLDATIAIYKAVLKPWSLGECIYVEDEPFAPGRP